MSDDINRIPRICEQIARIWSYHENFTFCKLIKNIVFSQESKNNQNIWFVKDDILEHRLNFEPSHTLNSFQLPLITFLEDSWLNHPTQRLGQLLSHFHLFTFSHSTAHFSDLTDDEVIKILNNI